MNQLNYASFEASKRLVETGIVLETERYFHIFDEEVHDYTAEQKKIWEGEVRRGNASPEAIFIPRPSMAEVWRELPEEYYKDATDPIRYKVLMSNQVGYHSGGKDAGIWFHIESNPADAIIYLLIRVRKEASHE